MTLNGSQRPDLEAVLGGLKDFQRDTVEYVFHRLYTDPDPVSRFLIADEVGLGKTLVARGVIARAVEHLWETVPRIDVVYICSNQDIAQQNIDRLNITADRHFQFASRATLLPITLQELRGNKLNFVSMTPGTSFEMSSSTGWKRERAVLFLLLLEHWKVSEGRLRNVLRGDVGRDSWRRELDYVSGNHSLDADLCAAFCAELDADPSLRQDYEALATEIGGTRTHLSADMRGGRNRFVGRLRQLLARSSLHALEPDLIILDEFQRFRHLLDPKEPAGLLAQTLFGFESAKVLLLSATPYKMYTLEGEVGEDHYKDFLCTVEFLLRDAEGALPALECAVDSYRQTLVRPAQQVQYPSAKTSIEAILRRVMVRTERLAASADRNGMLSETLVARDRVSAADLESYVDMDRIAQILGADDQVEYWKSAAYPLNLMDDYQLKRELTRALSDRSREDLTAALTQATPHLLHWQSLQAYAPVELANARLRALAEKSLDTRNWQLLWLPAALPYYQPGPPFSEVGPEGRTKSLVFSSWRLVPKSIAVLLSYEAERRMLGDIGDDVEYQNLSERRRPLLNFTVSRGRLTGMPVFCLMYPSLTLAQRIDPLALALEISDGDIPTAEMVFEAAKARVTELLAKATRRMSRRRRGREDERWYWAALALLDRAFYQRPAEMWLEVSDEALAWRNVLDRETSEDASDDSAGEARRFREHVDEFVKAFGGQLDPPLGPQPDDLADVLTYVALGSPSVAMLRTLTRLQRPAPQDNWLSHLSAAAAVGGAFRTLFNQPEATAMLQQRSKDSPYWRDVLRYAVDGNLQAVMDEYLHVLRESLGLAGHTSSDTATKLAQSVQRALALRAPVLTLDEIITSRHHPPSIEKHRMRCRYALPFGDDRTKAEEYTRSVDVRVAFNSPFRPFVLATTSVGQEGLDFHLYCHRVVHWNLPSNPVDLEQREGRVHRYKGHVIRRNLVQRYGLADLKRIGPDQDPWEVLFAAAKHDRPADANDLVPFWMYEAEGCGFRIEREIPVLPLSREIGRIGPLKRALALYRAVMGQPRQQELVEFLARTLDDGDLQPDIQEFVIDLSPPKRRI